MKLIELIFSKGWNKVINLWHSSKWKSILLALGLILLYFAVALVAYLIFNIFFPGVWDMFLLWNENAIIISTTIITVNSSENLKEFDVTLSSKLNTDIDYLLDINVFPDYSYTITNNLNSDILPSKEKPNNVRRHKFYVDYSGGGGYTLEIIARCGKENIVCGKATRDIR